MARCAATSIKTKSEVLHCQDFSQACRHSWTCSAISDYKLTFHDSKSRPGESDVCGYCGKQFPRSGRGPGIVDHSVNAVLRHVTEDDWKERFQHANSSHYFGQCNWDKKFYRADHFRQHLKHYHAWTRWDGDNALEAACIIEAERIG